MSVTIKSNEPVTGVPLELDFGSLWILRARRGSNPDYRCVFPFKGNKEEAVRRAREFCLRMNYKFIFVEPFLIDLDKTEAEGGYPSAS